VHFSGFDNQSFRELEAVLLGVRADQEASPLRIEFGYRTPVWISEGSAGDVGTEGLGFMHFVIKGNKIVIW
jgi:hypothetical protein